MLCKGVFSRKIIVANITNEVFYFIVNGFYVLCKITFSRKVIVTNITNEVFYLFVSTFYVQFKVIFFTASIFTYMAFIFRSAIITCFIIFSFLNSN